MNYSIDKQYIDLAKKVLKEGSKEEGRNGDTRSIFGATIRHSMKYNFPLITSKKVNFNAVVAEFLWMLKGKTDLRYLLDNNCNIWTGDFYRSYLEAIGALGNINANMYGMGNDFDLDQKPLTKEQFVKAIINDDDFNSKWGDDKRLYGGQWRNYNLTGLDQLYTAFYRLKNDPNSRRILVNSWNPVDVEYSILPPCHYSFQFNTRKVGTDSRELSLLWVQRSVDLPLGLPFNIAFYGLLLHVFAKMLRMSAGDIVGQLGNIHVYENQVETLEKQIGATTFLQPVLKTSDDINWEVDSYEDFNRFIHELHVDDFRVDNYNNSGVFKYPLSN